MMSIHRWVLVFVATLALVSPASAQSPADVALARQLFNEGLELSKAGKWEDAREKLARSLALKRAAITLYTLGVAEMKSGHPVAALEHLHAFVALPREPGTERFVEPAKKAIADMEARVGRVTIAVTPAGASDLEVTVDGVTVPPAALDHARIVDPGDHVIAAKAPGYRPAEQRVSVAPSAKMDVKLTLDPLPAEAAPKQVAPEPARAAEPPPTLLPKDESEAPSFLGPALMMGIGAAIAGAGIAVGLVAVQRAEDAPASEGPEADEARAMALGGDIGAGVGGLVAGAGFIWLLVLLGQSPDSESTALSPHGLKLRF
jgi:hypothetical protein